MRNKLGTVAAALLTLMAPVAFAAPHAEVGDASGTLAGAQSVTAGASGITGNLTQGQDTSDIYSFVWGGGAFNATVNGANFDTELGLWNSLFTLLQSNDDNGSSAICDDDDGFPNTGFCSTIDVANLAAGTYYLGIGPFNSTFGNDSLVPGGSNITAPGAYNIVFRTPVGGNVPEPASLALLGLGLAGLAASRRRARR